MSVEIEQVVKYLKHRMKKGNYSQVQIAIQDGQIKQVTDHLSYNVSAFEQFCFKLDSDGNLLKPLRVRVNTIPKTEGEQKNSQESPVLSKNDKIDKKVVEIVPKNPVKTGNILPENSQCFDTEKDSDIIGKDEE